MNGVNQILVIAVGALILLGVLGATNGEDGFIGRMQKVVIDTITTEVSHEGAPPAEGGSTGGQTGT